MAGAITSPELLKLAVALEDDPTRRQQLYRGYDFFEEAVRAGLLDRMNASGFALSVGEAVQRGYLTFSTEQGGVSFPPEHVPWTDHVLQSRFGYAPTLSGRQLVETSLNIALHQPPPPEVNERLEHARRRLRSGAKADAVVAAVEGALSPFLFELAIERGVSTTTADDRPLPLARLNDNLKTAGVYSKARHAQVSSWLHDRNEIAHGRGDAVATRWIELLIDGVEYLVSADAVSTAETVALAAEPGSRWP